MSTDADTASMHYAIDEGRDFLARHPDLDDPAATIGALTWGFLRAVYEAPCHPGVSMNPVPAACMDQLPRPGDWWYCPTCLLSYRYRSAEEMAAEATPKKRKRRGV